MWSTNIKYTRNDVTIVVELARSDNEFEDLLLVVSADATTTVLLTDSNAAATNRG